MCARSLVVVIMPVTAFTSNLYSPLLLLPPELSIDSTLSGMHWQACITLLHSNNTPIHQGECSAPHLSVKYNKLNLTCTASGTECSNEYNRLEVLLK